MSVQSVLLEYSPDDHLFSSSAILLDKRWIIFPAASILISLNNKQNYLKYLETLETSKLIRTNFLNMSSENLKIVTLSDKTKEFKFQFAKYIGIFSCKNIKATLISFPLACGATTENINFDSFLSLFIILDVKMEGTFKEIHLYNSINYLLTTTLSSLKLGRGSNICIESTPFGARELLNSYSQGILCNLVGENNCFILTDAPSAPMSEGAPIFTFKNNNINSQKLPVGIVISSLNLWRGEQTGLTLGAMLVPLMTQLLPQKWSFTEYFFSNKTSILNSADKSIVQVFCGNGWGTGILIDKKLGIFITGSHVVRTGNVDSITLKWRNKQSSCSLIYRTENKCIFDIAVLRCTDNFIEQMKAIKFATKPAIKGEIVLAAGYPIFNLQDFIFPVVTKGNVSLVDSCILHTTCCILAGSSGGAILRENGELLGVIVCHTTVSLQNEFVVYPKINMVIPISAISKPLLSYIKTKDINELHSLNTNDSYILSKWRLFQPKL